MDLTKGLIVHVERLTSINDFPTQITPAHTFAHRLAAIADGVRCLHAVACCGDPVSGAALRSKHANIG